MYVCNYLYNSNRSLFIHALHACMHALYKKKNGINIIYDLKHITQIYNDNFEIIFIKNIYFRF